MVTDDQGDEMRRTGTDEGGDVERGREVTPRMRDQLSVGSSRIALMSGAVEEKARGAAAYITYEWGKDTLVDGANAKGGWVIFEDKSTGKDYYTDDPEVVKAIEELKELIEKAKRNKRELDIAFNVREPEDTLEGFSYSTKK